MPVPLAPFPPHPYLPMQPSAGSQSQVICNGCRTLLLYPQGATNVRCALCSYVTAVPPQGVDMARLICGGCHTLLMYLRGATSVQCSWCQTVNLVMDAVNQVAYVNCGGCSTTLSYTYGAQSVRCAVCQFVTASPMSSMNAPILMQRPPFVPSLHAPISTPSPRPQTQTVVVENPMTVDESGKLVSNVAVGVTTDKN